MQDKNTNITEKATTLSIDDGLEKIVVTNKLGRELGTFYFNPTDTSIIDRYNETISMVGKVVEILQRGDLPAESDDAAANISAVSRVLNTAKVELYKAFDYLFDANVSEVFFSSANPFTLIGGKLYCEIVLEAVGAYLSSRLGVEVKRMNERLARYTHGYRTGKHRNGKK